MSDETLERRESAPNTRDADLELGRVWAELGLKIGKTALETAVVTIHRLAEAMAENNK